MLQIGTNDLACGVPPYEVACEVLNTAHELLMNYGVMRVVICGALYRIGHLRVPSHVDFDAVIDSYNTILREMCASERFVVYSLIPAFGATRSIYGRGMAFTVIAKTTGPMVRG